VVWSLFVENYDFPGVIMQGYVSKKKKKRFADP